MLEVKGTEHNNIFALVPTDVQKVQKSQDLGVLHLNKGIQ